mmetsp:Transcript_4665/g.17279  ORF Transcript_4665/g.17279 Transcript_4665/m.17279 type:complete len:201 (-) Transcript_4665:368-970(-)
MKRRACANGSTFSLFFTVKEYAELEADVEVPDVLVSPDVRRVVDVASDSALDFVSSIFTTHPAIVAAGARLSSFCISNAFSRRVSELQPVSCALICKFRSYSRKLSITMGPGARTYRLNILRMPWKSSSWTVTPPKRMDRMRNSLFAMSRVPGSVFQLSSTASNGWSCARSNSFSTRIPSPICKSRITTPSGKKRREPWI